MYYYTNIITTNRLMVGGYNTMILICESNSPKDYLMETEEVDFSHLSIKEKVSVLYSKFII